MRLRVLIAIYMCSAILLVLYSLMWLASRMLSGVETALAPICNAPIISAIVPFCGYFDVIKAVNAPMADYTQLMTLQSRLENVVELAGDYSLSQKVRSTEVAMRDLTAQLKVSDLASKDALAKKMEDFTAEAKDATRGLQRLSSRVGGSLDT